MSSTALTQTPGGSVQSQEASRSDGPNGQVAKRNPNAATAMNRSSSQPQTPDNAIKQAQPSQQPPSRSTPRPSTPGQWEHPRMQEILQRQRSTTFDQTNARRVVNSTIAIIVLTYGPDLLSTWILPNAFTRLIPTSLIWISYLVQLVLLVNIATASMPLLRKKDAIEDIPLTPRQRQLLDLPAMSRPATPQEQAAYVTPPRYARNTTPDSLDSLLVNARGTPLSGRNSPLSGYLSSTPPVTSGKGSNSTFFTGSSSKRTSDITMSRRRDSYGTPRSSPQALNELEVFGASTNKSSRASIGLNSKWLYDKGKDSPTSAGFLGSGWGSGSVFN